jgi:hypothetical protein
MDQVKIAQLKNSLLKLLQMKLLEELLIYTWPLVIFLTMVKPSSLLTTASISLSLSTEICSFFMSFMTPHQSSFSFFALFGKPFFRLLPQKRKKLEVCPQEKKKDRPLTHGSGALDPKMLDLAKSQSLAVDFPKTGIQPEVQQATIDLVNEKGYPDFMENKTKQSYSSTKLLGVLYREARTFNSHPTVRCWPPKSSPNCPSEPFCHPRGRASILLQTWSQTPFSVGLPDNSGGDDCVHATTHLPTEVFLIRCMWEGVKSVSQNLFPGLTVFLLGSFSADYTFENSFNSETIEKTKIDPHVKKYLQSASQAYDHYALSMTRLMSRFGVSKESHVILGHLLSLGRKELYSESGTMGKDLHSAWLLLRQKMRKIFFEEFLAETENPENPAHDTAVEPHAPGAKTPTKQVNRKPRTKDLELEKKAKASAWYLMTTSTNPKIRNSSPNQIFKSFGWLLPSELFPRKTPKSLPEVIASSCLNYLFKKQNSIQEFIDIKLKHFDQLKTAIRASPWCSKTTIHAHLFGSVGMFLNEIDSDTDVGIEIEDITKIIFGSKPNDIEKHETQVKLLELVVLPSIDSICTKKAEVFHPSALVPIVTCWLDEEETSSSSVDLCMNLDGYQKTVLIHRLYRSHAYVYPLFFCISEWARSVGLIKVAKIDGILKTAELHALIINLLDLTLKIQEDDQNQDKQRVNDGLMTFREVTDAAAKMTSSDRETFGNLFFQFFKKGSDLPTSIPLTLKWEVGRHQVHEIEESRVKDLVREFRRGYHLLALSNSFPFVLSQTTEKKIFNGTFPKILEFISQMRLSFIPNV